MSQENILYPVSSLKYFHRLTKDPYTWNIKFFQKFEKFKFYPKITETRVIKNVNSRNYAAAYYQSLEEVPWPLLPEKTEKHEKIAKILRNCLS